MVGGDPGLENLGFPLRVELFDPADQVPGFGVGRRLVRIRLEVQEQQRRGQ
ncbi:hypothetical protein D3C76_1881120 [compost metagenome]